MPDVSVRLIGEVELDKARREARRDFDRIGRDAEDSADDIRRAFDDAGEQISDGIADGAREADRALERVARSAGDTGGELEAAFQGVGEDIGREFDRIAAGAADSASDIDRAFVGVGDDIEEEFDRARRGADSALSRLESDADSAAQDMVPPFARAADRIEEEFDGTGEDIAGGFQDAFGSIDLGDASGSIVNQLGALGAVGGPIAGIAAGAAALFGDELASGIDRGLNARKTRIIGAVRTGLGADEIGRLGAEAGDAYADGFGESLEDLSFAAGALQKSLGAVDDDFDSDEVLRRAAAIEEVFGVDIPQAALVTRRAVANDLVDDSVEGLNLVAETARELPFEFEEALDVFSEFSPVFAKMGVDGGRAIDTITRAAQEGLLPNISRAGELFEEFNIRLGEADTLAEPIAELGLSFEEMQDKLASGRGAEALAEIAGALLDVEDEARRNALAVEIFGASIESASDPERVLELLALADAEREVGTAADEAAAAVEASQTEFDELSRNIEGGTAAATEFVLKMADIGGLLGETDTRTRNVADALSFLGIETEETATVTDGLTDAIGRSAEGGAGGSRSFEELGFAAGEAGGELSDLEQEVRDLDDALSDFSGRFDGDQVFRSIEENSRRALEAVEGLTAESYSLGEGFDVTTDEGAALEAQLERVSGDLDDLIREYQDGSISAGEFNAGQARVEATIRAVAAALNLGQAETQELIDKYGRVPDELTTDVKVEDRATNRLREINDVADDSTRDRSVRVTVIPPSITSTLNAIGRIPRSVNVRTRVSQFARGGVAHGLAEVGEEGPELAIVGYDGPELAFFDRPTRIVPNPKTRQMFGGNIPRLADGGVSFEERLAIIGDNPGARTDPEITAPQSYIEDAVRNVIGQGGRRINIEQVVVAEGQDLWQQLALTEQLYAVDL